VYLSHPLFLKHTHEACHSMRKGVPRTFSKVDAKTALQ
jgi:hypothetical protein